MPAPRSSIPAENLAAALETHVQRLREEQAWTAELGERAAVARKIIEDCDREHTESGKRQAALSQIIAQYEDLLALAEATTPPIEPPAPAASDAPALSASALGRPRLVARLGEQHYRMLFALRANGPLSLDELARASIASARRVKVQMAEDGEPGRAIVALNGDRYELTQIGADLLQRFEDFRRSIGRELPSLDAPQGEADRDEADPVTADEGDEG
ncbi:MAG TPA: hypothetical protein VGN83_06185 [Falsiroseomonas sp.]|jgi:hypothetical protein|nr:hypothetical protein [Falsiroseomonas sp.]